MSQIIVQSLFMLVNKNFTVLHILLIFFFRNLEIVYIYIHTYTKIVNNYLLSLIQIQFFLEYLHNRLIIGYSLDYSIKLYVTL